MQNRPLNQILPCQLIVIVGLFLLNACSPPIPAIPTPNVIPSSIPTSIVENTTSPDLPRPTIAVTATSLPTAIPETTLPTLMPGWVWYGSPNGVYTIAYPRQWQTGTVVGTGVFTFSSPETNSQIRISSRSVSIKDESNDGPVQFPDVPSATATPSSPACHDPSGTDWLDTVRANRSSMPGLPYGTNITINAIFSSQSAYFHFTPPPGAAGGSSILLLFCNTGTIVSLYYQGSTAEFLPAEAAIYQQMAVNFLWRGQTAEPLDIAFEQLFDLPVEATEITAVVSEVFVDIGIIVLEQPVEGFVTITLGVDGRIQTESGDSVDLEAIQPGQQVHAVGQSGQAGTLLVQEIEVLR